MTVRKNGKKIKEMVGAVINVNVELSGLRGQRVLLSQLEPRQCSCQLLDSDAEEEGPYVIRSSLTRNGHALDIFRVGGLARADGQ